MYKVFIFDKLIILLDEPVNLAKYPYRRVEIDSKKSLKEAYSNFVNSSADQTVILYNNQKGKRLLDEFISLFWYVEAAGGMVFNTKGERLFIYRFGKWDLPKGKIEKNESRKDAAIREVQEETGLMEVSITDELPSTFHIFDHKGKKVLKRTYWFKMVYTGSASPTPQIEEEITAARWFAEENMEIVIMNTYSSIREMITRN